MTAADLYAYADALHEEDIIPYEDILAAYAAADEAAASVA